MIVEDVQVQLPHPGVKWTNTTPSHYFEACESENQYEELEDFAIVDTKADFFVAYKPPRRDEACRICKILDRKGDTYQLYDSHLHNFPTGCPRYISMSVDERFKIACEANLCLRCHDPNYVYKVNDQNHNQTCQILVKGKGKFSCKAQVCNRHLWICIQHKSDNAGTLQNFKEEYQSRYNLEFGLAVVVPMFAKHSPKSPKIRRKVKKRFNVAKSVDLNKKVKVDNVSKSEVLPEPVTPSSNGPGDGNSNTAKNPKNTTCSKR